MRTLLGIFNFLIICTVTLNSQILNGEFYVPPYPVPELYYGDEAPELPDQVLNYKLPYFPETFYFQGHIPSCGQASAIYYCLTYEYNRLKNTPADFSSTFAPLYTYFFLNYGDNDYGASSFDSWNIVKNQGNPFLNDCPEYCYLNNNDLMERLPIWMSGYDKYYRAMQNKISGYYSLDVSTDEGLRLLQHYLNDHLRQESSGGTAIIYGYTGNISWSIDSVLNPDSFTYTVYDLYNSATHSMAIVGYYVNQRIDFNEDGYISDSLDTNGDSLIDFRDNEKVLWVLANSYDTIPNLYLFKYCLLAECFNGKVFLPVPDTSYKPSLTTKIRLTHPLRGFIKISVGISSNLNSEIPEHIIDFPVFNFQGGPLPMQGDDTVANPEAIEFGLDISPILQYIENDEIAKLFLIVDNASFIDGVLTYFSIIRYDSGNPVEFAATINDTLLPKKSCTKFSVNVPLVSNFDESKLRIDSDNLYIITDTSNNNIFISAIGGTPPYSFYKYREDEYSQQLCSYPYEIDPYTNTSIFYDSLVIANTAIPFAGETFDTVIFGKKGNILFRTEEPPNSKKYPYQYYPHIPLYDMEIRNFYPDQLNFSRRYGYDDTCSYFYHYGYAKNKTVINNNGIIQLGYTTTSADWHHSSYVRTRSKTYYSNLLPYSYQSEYKSAIFYPVPDTSGISVSREGEISLNSNIPSGVYKTYVLVIDSVGDKATKLINIEVSNSAILNHLPILTSVFPNPAKNELFIEFENNKIENVTIDIVNSIGEKVYSGNFVSNIGQNTLKIPLKSNNFGCGYYIGKLKTGNEINLFKFVIIE